ncbi:OLC1v1015112C1 [Oldenlandia corymbosa var. corymbosa]|uniref:OLC1v1015112C1 n=1 Tax=Oldenlandia corymbosa var. corymbosa TaxID=529605 RepID=A0AAV1E2J9_OLDCO|nr:OLC1v1015112C1 [Oldenlandia corymbosa var. corymbosa]
MDQYHHHQYHKYSSNTTTTNPSFSSTLLDEIYRSIDFETQTNRIQGEVQDHHQLVVYKETMRKKQSSSNINSNSMKPKKSNSFRDEEEMANYQRACLIEKWMEKKVVVNRRNFNEYVDAASSTTSTGCTTFFNNSSSSSSDSSSGGGFSSSEAESVYGFPSSRGPSCYGINKPKPIRTSTSEKTQSHHHHKNRNYLQPTKAEKHEETGRFVKTKSRALKIYGDLKKVKQPISPGGRLASFLNSIFTAGNSKKAKYDDETIDSERKFKSANASTCSSASSFSRSCLSKKSSNINGSSGMKRSVRFYPVSVIVDEDSQPCGQKSLYDQDDGKTGKNSSNNIRASLKDELQLQALEKNRRVQEAARDLLRNFQKRVDQCEFDMIRSSARISDQELVQNDNILLDEDDDEDMDDDASYASSDLFELDNLSAIGMDHQRYREELPVYETTHLGTNRAIANGLIL